jgi:PTH1 family peptidyl-tRNA hydrolase
MKIIFAQGNPEPQYENTRHNVGCSVLNEIAEINGLKWSDKPREKMKITEYLHGGEKILLVKPTSYYNETGSVVRRLVDFYKIDPINDLLVVHDDITLPFGSIRVRHEGSDGGNNGIKSINSTLGTNYARIRIGTDNDMRAVMGDADFVLAKFSSDEQTVLNDKILPRVIELFSDFLSNKLEITSHKAK